MNETDSKDRRDLAGNEDRGLPVEDPSPSSASGSTGRGKRRDYWALSVFAGLVVLVFVLGFLGLREVGWDFFQRPVTTTTKWLKAMEREITSQVEEKIKGLQPSAKQAKNHIRQGYRFYRKNQIQEAVKSYGKAIEMDPNNAEAFFWRGRAFLQAEKYDEALADFRMAVKLRPSYTVAHDNLGWLYARRKEYKEGIQHLSKSIALNPRNGWTYYTRARCYFGTGDTENALSDLKKACDLGYKEACELYEKHQKTRRKGT